MARGGEGGSYPPASDHDDLVRLHSRRCAAGDRQGRRRRDASGAGHGGLLRHVGRHLLRAAVHAGLLCGLPAIGQCAKALGATGTIGQGGGVAMKRALLLLPLLALAGCWSVGPDYEQPALPETGAFKGGPAPLVSADPPPERWWEGFSDPTLNTLIDKAVAGNYDLKAATANL